MLAAEKGKETKKTGEKNGAAGRCREKAAAPKGSAVPGLPPQLAPLLLSGRRGVSVARTAPGASRVTDGGRRRPSQPEQGAEVARGAASHSPPARPASRCPGPLFTPRPEVEPVLLTQHGGPPEARSVSSRRRLLRPDLERGPTGRRDELHTLPVPLRMAGATRIADS